MAVVNFTGKRKSATSLDRKEVADWLRKTADQIENGEIIGILYAALLAEPGRVDWDWFTVPPANRFTAIGAIQGLLADYTADAIANSVIEEDPTSEGA